MQRRSFLASVTGAVAAFALLGKMAFHRHRPVVHVMRDATGGLCGFYTHCPDCDHVWAVEPLN